ncbi:uncharacterized protein EDB91DRAFT_1351878 [Suillus paluster]|uniref:uncharacterized protein n=1 Tax=Suillus paluster TaxID=48578 RepID=UPI001B87888B|nr:uncharacterized protein EDB91DRAFT_1351878 [Suillus paluster]KAG1719638.1 hypothetical protein EDB91DRAFT_1351878 [Suillus paluster]
MVNTPGATAPKTPPHGVDAVPQLKSTPNAVGSAVVSEHISTLGVDVHDIRPWITRDVQDFSRCEFDEMLRELLYRCRDPSKSPPTDKSTLLNDSFQAVLPLCNQTSAAQDINKHLSDFVKCTTEVPSYAPFIRAANRALLELSDLDAPGLLSSKTHDDSNDILFHLNDPMFMKQTHQGAEARRKPDVVIISRESARHVRKNGKDCTKEHMYGELACRKPDVNFQWTGVRSILEFKRTKTRLQTPPSTYTVKDYDASDQKYMEYHIRNETSDPAEPAGSTPAPADGPTQSSHETSNAQPPTQSGQSKRKGDKKRTSGHLDSSEPSSKRPKSNNENQGNEKEPKRIHPIVQNGVYVAELFAAHVARQHVISCVVNDDMLYLWYFDRQNAIQCSGINFVQDLPRFMVLLLAMQRMAYAHWGYNPVFEREPGSSGEIHHVEDPKHGLVDLKFDLKSDDRTTHFGLRGRATTVFPVESIKLSSLLSDSHNTSSDLVAKLYWPEESRESEPEILKKVYKIAEREMKVKGHVPDMVWFHKFEGTSTANIRKALGMDDAERGSRVLYIIVFRKLIPITKLSGMEFLTAWWQVVVCHHVLWENGVYHRDVSPSNLMVFKTSDGRWIGVLNDYDLSSTTHDGPRGKERTGTVPFMAIDLLTQKALEGKVDHRYQHDAESLMWVLAWVCLRYEGGELLSKGRPLDDWLRVDAIRCREKKTDFLFVRLRDDDLRPSASHQENWTVARSCLLKFASFFLGQTPTLENEFVFQTWLLEKIPDEAKIPPSFQD